MFCSKCGKQMRDGSKFCPDCGEAVASAISPGASKTPMENSSLQQGWGNGMSLDVKTDGGVMSFDTKSEGSGKKKWIISIAAVIAVLVLLISVGTFLGRE